VLGLGRIALPGAVGKNVRNRGDLAQSL
jgi:hypothetical protein